MIYFTADTHFNHKNIIQYSNRPFQSVEEMNQSLIDNINALVKSNDELYHLGDFAFGNVEKFRRQINCKNLHIIFGNHDREARLNKHLFSSYSDFREIKVFGKSITLCHYAMRVWNKSHHGAYHLYGHSHGSLPDDPNSRSFDCGVDCHGYKPISFDEVTQLMSKKTWKAVDHHGTH